MKKKLCCVAMLAASAFAVPANAAVSADKLAASAFLPMQDHAHIRTMLHGTDGPVIVFIPGMSTPAAVWDDTVHALAATHRLLVVEVKGFDGARVAANEKPGLMDGIVADLVSDLNSRGIKRATLVGHSFGGLLSLKLAIEHPAMAERLLIVDALPFFGTIFDPAATIVSSRPRADAMRQMLLVNADTMRMLGERGASDGSRAAGMSVNEDTRIKIANWSLKAEPTVVAQAIHEDFLSDLRPQLATLNLPVTVLYQADNAHGANAERYRQDYAALRGVELVGAANSGHFIQLDQHALFLSELAKLMAR